ncbi:MAG: excinuclease ABC subunit UvrA, partial [Leptospiraceae bacterium]|nr:excinuclease ABC subunit UvrA [Leptospiraceae bacterium]
ASDVYKRQVGKPHCPKCGTPIANLSVDQIVERVLTFPSGSKLQILSPVIRSQKGEHKEIFDKLKKEGFNRVRVNGEVLTLDEEIQLKKNIKSSIDIVVDRIVLKEGVRTRLTDSIEIALKHGDGSVVINDLEKDHLFSSKLSCPNCPDVSIPELEPRLFSFNSPYGACPTCDGIGSLLEFDEELVVSDPELSLAEGCFEVWGKTQSYWYMATISALGKTLKFDINKPWRDLPENVKKTILYGDSNI